MSIKSTRKGHGAWWGGGGGGGGRVKTSHGIIIDGRKDNCLSFSGPHVVTSVWVFLPLSLSEAALIKAFSARESTQAIDGGTQWQSALWRGCSPVWICNLLQLTLALAGQTSVGEVLPVYVQSEQASLNATEVMWQQRSVSLMQCLFLWTCGGRAVMLSGPWTWPGVGLLGQASWDQCHWSQHEWRDSNSKTCLWLHAMVMMTTANL